MLTFFSVYTSSIFREIFSIFSISSYSERIGLLFSVPHLLYLPWMTHLLMITIIKFPAHIPLLNPGSVCAPVKTTLMSSALSPSHHHHHHHHHYHYYHCNDQLSKINSEPFSIDFMVEEVLWPWESNTNSIS